MSIEAKPNRPTFVTRIVDGCDLRKSPSSIVSKLLGLHISLKQKNTLAALDDIAQFYYYFILAVSDGTTQFSYIMNLKIFSMIII